MSHYKISHRFAQALLSISVELDLLDVITEDLKMIEKTFIGSKEFQSFLKSPVIKTDKKLKIIDDLFKSKVSNEVLKFLHLVVKKRRESFLNDIIKAFLNLRNIRLGIIEISLRTASQFNAEQLTKLQNILESITNKKVLLTVFIDGSLKGGFIFQIDDTVFDSSIKRQLELLHKRFLFGQFDLN